jgi:hypothetical protein
VDAATTVNNYVVSFNENAPDVAAKTGPAIDSLNHNADLVSGSLSDALSPQLRDALTGWVDGQSGCDRDRRQPRTRPIQRRDYATE